MAGLAKSFPVKKNNVIKYDQFLLQAENSDHYQNMREKKNTIVCFRNDDVNYLCDELERITDIFLSRKIPITHAVEPGNLSIKTINWLKKIKIKFPELIEIVQHGWDHSSHGVGEFGKNRSYIEQYNDLLKGKKQLERIFGNNFFPLLTIPFGIYTKDTINAANSLGYKVFCSYYRNQLSRRIFYKFGHLLKRGLLFGRHISNHLDFYPGTKLFEIDTSISFIKKYLNPLGNECEMYSANEILLNFDEYKRHIPAVIFLLHHRYHIRINHINLVHTVLDNLQIRKDVVFANYSTIYREYSKR